MKQHTVLAFRIAPRLTRSSAVTRTSKLFSSSTRIAVENNISRLDTLQELLAKHGAPGSQGCQLKNDLESVLSMEDTPELVTSLTGGHELANLHPYLLPIAKSRTTGNLICAYRNPSTESSNAAFPWPIVETAMDAPGFQVLALNSEHLMRRIACEADEAHEQDIIDLYNHGLGMGKLKDPQLDIPYQAGAVAKLGYGVAKYTLIRVGPFADLYEQMAWEHKAKGDEQSALIAAEAANAKLNGVGSTFRFYARIINSFPNRQEEARDAARMCLRLPLPTIGMQYRDLKEVAVLGQLVDEKESDDAALTKLKAMYEKMKDAEQEDPQQGKTMEQKIMEDASSLIDEALLSRKPYGEIRGELAELFRSIQREDMADFVTLVAK